VRSQLSSILLLTLLLILNLWLTVIHSLCQNAISSDIPQGFSLPPGQVVLIFLMCYVRSSGLGDVPYGHTVSCGVVVRARSDHKLGTYGDLEGTCVKAEG